MKKHRTLLSIHLVVLGFHPNSAEKTGRLVEERISEISAVSFTFESCIDLEFEVLECRIDSRAITVCEYLSGYISEMDSKYTYFQVPVSETLGGGELSHPLYIFQIFPDTRAGWEAMVSELADICMLNSPQISQEKYSREVDYVEYDFWDRRCTE